MRPTPKDIPRLCAEALQALLSGVLRRALLCAAAAYGFGLWLAGVFAHWEIPHIFVLFLLVAVALGALLIKDYRKLALVCGVLLCAGFLAGASMWGFLAEVRNTPAKEVTVRLCVLSAKENDQGEMAYKAGYVSVPEGQVPGFVMLYMEEEYPVGQWLEGRATLRAVTGYENHGVMPTYLSRAAKHQFYAVVDPRLQPASGPVTFSIWAHKVRQTAITNCRILFPQNQGLLQAILLGEMDDLSEELSTAFRVSGLLHTLVVSGMHVGLVLGVCWWLWRRLKFLPRAWMPYALSAFLCYYALLTGFASPVVRAVVVAGLVLWGPPLLRKTDMPTLTALAFLVLVVLQPMRVLSVGFTLSFLAVFGLWAGLTWIRPWLNRKWVKAVQPLFVSICAQLSLWPLVAREDGYGPLLGIVLGAVIVLPMTGLIAIGLPMVLASMAIGLPDWLMWAANIVDVAARVTADAFIYIVAHTPFISYEFLRPLPWVGFLGYFIVLVLAFPFGATPVRTRLRIISVVAAVSMTAVLVINVRAAKTPQVYMMDVGQGQCVYIHTAQDQVYLVDTGGVASSVEPLRRALRAQGVRKIQGIFYTHSDADHTLALPVLAEYFEIGAIYYPEWVETKGDLVSADITRLRDGQLVPLGPDAMVEIINTPDEMMCVVLKFYGTTFFFTGDITAKGERYLLEADLVPDCDVLQVGHHGSGGSSIPEFIEAADPHHAWISCGRYNGYGHPAPETLETLAARGIAVKRTDQDGGFGLKWRQGRWEYAR